MNVGFEKKTAAMNKSLVMSRRQAGSTMWTTLSITLMLGFTGYFAAITGGMFWDNYLVRSSMQDIVNQTKFKKMTKRQVVSAIDKRLVIDGVRDISRGSFSLKKDLSGERYIHIQYEAKSSFIANLFISAKFDQEIKPGQ